MVSKVKVPVHAPTGKERVELKEKYDAGGPKAMNQVAWQWISATAVFFYCLYDSLYVKLYVEESITWANVIMINVITYFAIDILSGLLHIILDNPFFAEKENWGGFIEPFAKGFQEHHLDTTLIGSMPVAEHLKPMSFPLIINYGVGLLTHRHHLFSTYQVALTFWLLTMQMAHRWSHVEEKKRPLGVKQLQQIGFLISPAEHKKHHKAPYKHQFCIMSGLMNTTLNKIVDKVDPHSPQWIYGFGVFSLIPHGLLLTGLV